MAATKYPPLGNRGLDGAGLDCNFGGDSWTPNSTYIADANRETFIVAQIETPEAVANAEEIAAVPGIDAFFVGPGDLACVLDAYPEIGMSIDESVAQVAAAADKHGKVWARTASSIEEVDRYRPARLKDDSLRRRLFPDECLEKCQRRIGSNARRMGRRAAAAMHLGVNQSAYLLSSMLLQA